MPRKTSNVSKSKPDRAALAARDTGADYRARIRMYRLGVGDCFLLSLPKGDGGTFRMLIDCGVHQAQKGGADRIREVVKDIKEVTGGELDVVVGTHEHWDHISGFHQAREQFKDMSAGQVWFAWTEDDTDEMARAIAPEKRYGVLDALSRAEARMRVMGLEGADNPLTGILGFFGPGAGKNLAKCGEILKAMSGDIRYHKPENPPIELPGNQARVFVLGPPRDETLLEKSDPSKRDSEVYHFGDYDSALAAMQPVLSGGVAAPFDDRYALPLSATTALPFFQNRYWAESGPDEARGVRDDVTQSWRRIARDWLSAASSLALKLDEDTNNTSLVLAIELGPPDEDGDVLLFTADAQVGNWLSWQDLVWDDYHGRRITGPDLLKRTLVYKVGHHASHNATLKKLGLEMMNGLKLALVPTDDEMAAKVGWGKLPFPPLLKRLAEKTGNRVVRSDRAVPRSLRGFKVTKEDLFYEIEL